MKIFAGTQICASPIAVGWVVLVVEVCIGLLGWHKCDFCRVKTAYLAPELHSGWATWACIPPYDDDGRSWRILRCKSIHYEEKKAKRAMDAV